MSVQQNNPLRGRLNAWFLAAIDGYVNRLLHAKKSALFADLSGTVVEIGPGVGANLAYLAGADRVIGIEPNAHMRPILERRAARRGVKLEILPVGAEATGLPEASVDFVVCTLVLCTVGEPRRVLEEIRRILKPGGKFLFVEHVGAPHGSVLRRLQKITAAALALCVRGVLSGPGHGVADPRRWLLKLRNRSVSAEKPFCSGE